MNNINNIKKRGGRSQICKSNVLEYLVIPLTASVISIIILLWIWHIFGY